jgi:phosphoenolpyruvate carboxykinase (ATP)
MPLHPTVYAKLLGEKMEKYDTKAYLVNTGWSGGPYGVGKRMKIQVTRSCVNAILDGKCARKKLIQHLRETVVVSVSRRFD